MEEGQWKEKLVALLEGLEVQNVSLLLNKDPKFFREFGEIMANKMKNLIKWKYDE